MNDVLLDSDALLEEDLCSLNTNELVLISLPDPHAGACRRARRIRDLPGLVSSTIFAGYGKQAKKRLRKRTRWKNARTGGGIEEKIRLCFIHLTRKTLTTGQHTGRGQWFLGSFLDRLYVQSHSVQSS